MKKLLKAGCQPYFQMLEKWLCEGDLDDPFQEFMVCQDSVSCWLTTPIPPGLLRTPSLFHRFHNKASICLRCCAQGLEGGKLYACACRQ